MSHGLRLYLVLLLAVVAGWIWLREPALAELWSAPHRLALAGITALYLCSHLLRMLRLVLLTLDERSKAVALTAAHVLTAFPSSFLPFKIGEILRLIAFFRVYDGRRKALAIWISERFGDVVVISAFILSLYLFNVAVPPTMRIVFVVFVLASAIGALSLFALAKVFVFLNRHLVLSSHSERGLRLLRASHALRRMEVDVYRSVAGRLSGFLLLSVLIWAVEILALSLFINQLSIGEPDFAAMFASGLLANLPGGSPGGANAFGLYQSLALVILTVLFIGAWAARARSKHFR